MIALPEPRGAVTELLLHALARPVGPLAIVLSDDKAAAAARVLGILASADRPIKLFTSLPPARRWIDSLVPAL